MTIPNDQRFLELWFSNQESFEKDLQYLSNIEFEDIDLSFGLVTQSTLLDIIAENESDLTDLIIEADEIVTQSTLLQIVAENEIDLTELSVWTGRSNIAMNVEDKKTPHCLYYNSNFEECIRDIEEVTSASTGATIGFFGVTPASPNPAFTTAAIHSALP